MKINSIKTAIIATPDALAKKVRTVNEDRTIKKLRSKNLQFNTMAAEMSYKIVMERLRNGEYNRTNRMEDDQKREYILHLKALNGK